MTKDETDLIIAEQNKSTEELLKAVTKVKSDYHELCKLKDMRIADLESQIEKMKYALNKIIKTVHNDNVSSYGDRLVIIYDTSCEVLQEIKEK